MQALGASGVRLQPSLPPSSSPCFRASETFVRGSVGYLPRGSLLKDLRLHSADGLVGRRQLLRFLPVKQEDGFIIVF